MRKGLLQETAPALVVLGCVALHLGLAGPCQAATVRIHYAAGAGHSIAIRGSLPPLSWSSGVAAQPLDDDVWLWQSPPAADAFEFRPYLDDRSESTGANYRVPAGAATVDVYPFFGPARGRFEVVPDFASPQLQNVRPLFVFLPPSYDENLAKRYPVLYMHDGQNLFDRTLSASTLEWQVDETLDRLVGRGRVREVIVVGIGNNQQRTEEYTPTRDPREGKGGAADRYLDFLVQTVKPFVDGRYRTLPGPEATVLMGSSLGGLLSFYAGWTRSEVFGAVGCLSSSFWWDNQRLLKQVARHRGPRPPVRVYLDCGNPYDGRRETRRMRKALRKAGWREGDDLFYAENPAHHHSEECWAARLPSALEALLPFSDEVALTPPRTP